MRFICKLFWLAPIVLALGLAGCQTAGPAAKSAAARQAAAQPSTAGGQSVLNQRPSDSASEIARAANAVVAQMLERIPPSDIEMMEIFRGPGELPGEFNNGNCGAISIWTRHNH